VSDCYADAVQLLTSWDAPDAEQESRRREYVAHLERHADGLSRSCLPDHITASTLVLSADAEHVLLTLHAKAAKWFQLGGHVEPRDVSLHAAALREAIEESGLTEVLVHPAPVHLHTHAVPFCGGRPGTHHLDVRFVAVAPPGAAHAVSEESLDVRWWPVADLPSDEPSLRRLVELGRDRVGHL
jgi:8-oxo-dGTP pyrophosphatase MutT (NUDIX family)